MPKHDTTNKILCVPIKDSDQHGHLPSLVSLCCPSEESIFSSDGQQRLTRLDGCPGWPESSLGAQSILLCSGIWLYSWADAQADLSLCWAQGWSESLLGVILLVLSCSSSFHIFISECAKLNMWHHDRIIQSERNMKESSNQKPHTERVIQSETSYWKSHPIRNLIESSNREIILKELSNQKLYSDWLHKSRRSYFIEHGIFLWTCDKHSCEGIRDVISLKHREKVESLD